MYDQRETRNPKGMSLEEIVSLPKGTKLKKVYSQYPNMNTRFILSHTANSKIFGTTYNDYLGRIVPFETNLADAGVIPYAEKRWNTTNYIVLGEEELVKEREKKIVLNVEVTILDSVIDKESIKVSVK